MKKDCNIVMDILPLYIEDMVSDDTKEFVQEHLSDCEKCQATANNLKKSEKFAEDISAAPLKTLRKKLKIKKVQTVIFTAALVLAIVISLFAYLTAPQYFPYSSDILAINEDENGTVNIMFSEEITGYTCSSSIDSETGILVYDISGWNSILDLHFLNSSTQNIIIETSADRPIAIYYSQNNTKEDVLIYGTDPNPNGGIITLPRLVFGYYFIIAVFTLVVLMVALLVFWKKETIKIWIEKIILLPVSYILGHICIKGLSPESYSSQRDFFLILFVAICIYCAFLFGFYLYSSKREKDNTDCF